MSLGPFSFALPPRCSVVVPLLFGLVAALLFPRNCCSLEVAPVPTPRAVARGGGSGCSLSSAVLVNT